MGPRRIVPEQRSGSNKGGLRRGNAALAAAALAATAGCDAILGLGGFEDAMAPAAASPSSTSSSASAGGSAGAADGGGGSAGAAGGSGGTAGADAGGGGAGASGGAGGAAGAGGSDPCTPSPCLGKRAFVTSVYYDGILGGVSGANAECQLRATAANLCGAWIAWIAFANDNPNNNLPNTPAEYCLVDGTPIGTKIDLLAGSLLTPIVLQEDGGTVPAPLSVWTGAIGGMSSNVNCMGWTSDVPNGVAGQATAQNSAWENAGVLPCAQTARLYCFEL
jgi:hypothetical protein